MHIGLKSEFQIAITERSVHLPVDKLARKSLFPPTDATSQSVEDITTCDNIHTTSLISGLSLGSSRMHLSAISAICNIHFDLRTQKEAFHGTIRDEAFNLIFTSYSWISFIKIKRVKGSKRYMNQIEANLEDILHWIAISKPFIYDIRQSTFWVIGLEYFIHLNVIEQMHQNSEMNHSCKVCNFTLISYEYV